MNGFYSPLAWTRGQLESARGGSTLRGAWTLASSVRSILMDADTAMYESCQGGKGHAYAEPTIRFAGTPACGWRALAILMRYDLPIRRPSQI